MIKEFHHTDTYIHTHRMNEYPLNLRVTKAPPMPPPQLMSQRTENDASGVPRPCCSFLRTKSYFASQHDAKERSYAQPGPALDEPSGVRRAGGTSACGHKTLCARALLRARAPS